MRSDVQPIAFAQSAPRWNRDDEIIYIEDTLRSEFLAFDFEHLIEGCTCPGKTCSKCHKKQCHHAFARDKRKRDGLHGHCRMCCNTYRATRRQALPDVVRTTEYNARARKSGTTTTLTAEEWANLKALHNYRCLCCGKQEPEITLTPDHVIPLSKGGSNSISNLQPLCCSCNKKKFTASTDFRPSRNVLS